MNPLKVDDVFLAQQNEWNNTELLHMAATVHDIRRRHADEIMDDASSPSETSSNELLSDDNQSSLFHPRPP